MGPAQLAGVLSIVARAVGGGQRAGRTTRRPTRDAGAGRGADRGGVLPLFLSGTLYDDGVIDPRDTRTVARPLPVGDHQRAGARAPRGSACSGCEGLRTRRVITRTVDSLVANRGEIARRVFATCRRLGHRDRRRVLRRRRRAARTYARPTRPCACRATRPAETYLRADLVLEAALARRRRRGPPRLRLPVRERRLRARGGRRGAAPGSARRRRRSRRWASKIAAKKLMAAAGVPVLHRAHRPAAATEAELPCWSRPRPAVAGAACGWCAAWPICRGSRDGRAAEAASAFGDGTVFCEPYIEHAGATSRCRCSADAHGTRVGLGERECSIQRRHQKVVEEAPSPARRATIRAARKLFDGGARRGRGDRLRRRRHRGVPLRRRTGRFFFLEMNTRLQVEHPVTELRHGAGPGRAAAAVAEGAPLPRRRPATRRPRDRGPALRRGPGRTTGSRRAARCIGSSVPGVDASSTCATAGLRLDSGVESRLGRRRALRPDARQGHRLGAATRRGGAGCWPRRSRRRHPRRRDQPRPAWSTCSGIRHFGPAKRIRPF